MNEKIIKFNNQLYNEYIAVQFGVIDRKRDRKYQLYEWERTEKGSCEGVIQMYKYALNTVDKEISFPYISRLRIELFSQGQSYIKKDAFTVTTPGQKMRFGNKFPSSQKKAKAIQHASDLQKELNLKKPPYEIVPHPDERYKDMENVFRICNTDSADSAQDAYKKLLNKYNTTINSLQNSEEKILLIFKTFRDLELCHTWADFNMRTHLVLINRELLKHDLSPFLPNDPNLIVNQWLNEEIVAFYQKGKENYENLNPDRGRLWDKFNRDLSIAMIYGGEEQMQEPLLISDDSKEKVERIKKTENARKIWKAQNNGSVPGYVDFSSEYYIPDDSAVELIKEIKTQNTPITKDKNIPSHDNIEEVKAHWDNQLILNEINPIKDSLIKHKKETMLNKMIKNALSIKNKKHQR